MGSKRIGRQTVALPSRPFVRAASAYVGKKEGEGPLGGAFDYVAADELYGQESFELAEKQLYLDAISHAVRKAGLKPDDIQFLLGGDLLNQIITASFSARELGVPFIGLYGACSTMAESLCLGGMLVDGGFAGRVACAASSHFCTAERQYRFPLEFGSQRTPTAQWTVTGAGAAVVSAEGGERPLARVTHACMGRVVDLGITDANNMGAAMAPVSVNIGPSLVRGGLQSTIARHVEVNLGPYAGGIGAGGSLKRRGRTEKRMAAWDGRNLYGVSVSTKGCTNECTKDFREKGGGGSTHGDGRERADVVPCRVRLVCVVCVLCVLMLCQPSFGRMAAFCVEMEWRKVVGV